MLRKVQVVCRTSPSSVTTLDTRQSLQQPDPGHTHRASTAPVMMVMMRTWLVLAAAVLLARAQTIPRQMTIAAVFDEGGDPKHELAFHHAVQSINRNR